MAMHGTYVQVVNEVLLSICIDSGISWTVGGINHAGVKCNTCIAPHVHEPLYAVVNVTYLVDLQEQGPDGTDSFPETFGYMFRRLRWDSRTFL